MRWCSSRNFLATHHPSVQNADEMGKAIHAACMRVANRRTGVLRPAACSEFHMSDVPAIYATLFNYDLLIEALDERRKELNISCNELDDRAGIATGYFAKCVGSRTKTLAWKTVFKVARQLGLRLVFEVDSAATKATLAVARRRNVNQAREGNMAARCSPRARQRV